VAAVAGEYVANNSRASQACMIEHVVIYQYDASAADELSLAVDERVWVCTPFLVHHF